MGLQKHQHLLVIHPSKRTHQLEREVHESEVLVEKNPETSKAGERNALYSRCI